jgi:nucleotide-binding universal stress UspA family protein
VACCHYGWRSSAGSDTIIVGVDGSERSRDALALADLLARAAGARLLIAHVQVMAP